MTPSALAGRRRYTCRKTSDGILADDIEISGRGLHVFLESADAKRLCFDRMQGVKETDASFIYNYQLLDRLCDLFNNVRGYDNNSRMFLKALRQHIVKLHAHNRVETETGSSKRTTFLLLAKQMIVETIVFMPSER